MIKNLCIIILLLICFKNNYIKAQSNLVNLSLQELRNTCVNFEKIILHKGYRIAAGNLYVMLLDLERGSSIVYDHRNSILFVNFNFIDRFEIYLKEPPDYAYNLFTGYYFIDLTDDGKLINIKTLNSLLAGLSKL
jgi:hypothetical protein